MLRRMWGLFLATSCCGIIGYVMEIVWGRRAAMITVVTAALAFVVAEQAKEQR